MPPPKLYHGTATSNLESIRNDGLKKMARHHVHLSPDVDTATPRRGEPFHLAGRQVKQIHDGAGNPKQVEAYRGGKDGLLGFFVGQVMKETGGKANPQVVNERLREKLNA